MKKQILFAVVIALSFAACSRNGKQATSSNQPNDTVITNNAANAENKQKTQPDWLGTYTGVLPCADCDGMKVHLTLNDDTTFFMKTEYIGRGEPFVDKGQFFWNDDKTKITLELDGGKQQYAVEKDALVQLDQEGNKITGELANAYILNKAY